VTKHATRPEQQ